MFSRRDPIQPQKVSRNMRTPTTIRRMAGSTARQAKAASGGSGCRSVGAWSRLRVAPRGGVGRPSECSPPLAEGASVWLGEGYGEAVLPSHRENKRAQQGSWHLI